MNEVSTEKLSKRTGSAPVNSARQNSLIRSSIFKYYIHDSIASCRLQLIGELTDAEVPELNGCWRTARTTLGRRKLVLDLQALKSVDEAGKQWLAGMAQEGASCVPESYLRDLVAGKHTSGTEAPPASVKLSVFGRVLALLRGYPVETAK